MRRHRGTRRITGPQRRYLAHLVAEARSHGYVGYRFDDTRPNARYLPDLHHLDQLSFDEASRGIEKLKEAKAAGWSTVTSPSPPAQSPSSEPTRCPR